MVRAFIALGANLGDTHAALRQAVRAIGSLPYCEVGRVSSFYVTEPWGVPAGAPAGDDYLNAVLELHTTLPAPALLGYLQGIEQAAGRERPYVNAPRTLDLDVLLYGSARVDSAFLTVPHPRMLDRAFVLEPLAEIAPELVTAAQRAAVSDQVIRCLGPGLTA